MATQLQKPAMNNKWAQAIDSGEFEDDDAQMVKGIDTMDDGNMARRRRQQAAQTAFQYVERNYSENSLRRDQNGQIPPRSRFRGAGHIGPLIIDQSQRDSDEPIDINATITAAVRQQASQRGRMQPAASPARRTISVQTATTQVRCSPAHSPAPKDTPAKHVNSTVKPLAPVTAATQNPPQTTQNVLQILPDGACILIQLPISMLSAALPERSQRYQAKVTVVSGSNFEDDSVVFVLDKAGMDNIKHSASEYSSRMDASNTAVMLQFTVNKKPIYYALEFSSADTKKSFDESLQKLVDRAKLKHVDKPSIRVASAPVAVSSRAVVPPTEAQPPKVTETSKAHGTNAAAPAATTAVQLPKVTETTKATAGNVVAKANGMNAVSRITPVANVEKSTTRMITAQNSVEANASPLTTDSYVSPQLTEDELDEVVHAVVDTAIYMRDCTPDNYSLDMMKSIIRGTTAAFMTKKYPGFRNLMPAKRAELVEGHWVPAVSDRFIGWLRSEKEDTQKADTQKVVTQKVDAQKQAQTQKLETRENLDLKVRRVFSMSELMALKSGAIDMAHKLPPNSFFACPIQSARRVQMDLAKAKRTTTSVPSVESQIQRAASAADWVHQRTQTRPAPAQYSDESQIPLNMRAADFELVAQPQPSVEATAKQPDSSEGVADWLFGSRETEHAKKHSGLNSSIHNLPNADVLDGKSGQFTGVFTRTSDYQDLVDIFHKADQDKDKKVQIQDDVFPLTQEFRRLSLK